MYCLSSKIAAGHLEHGLFVGPSLPSPAHRTVQKHCKRKPECLSACLASPLLFRFLLWDQAKRLGPLYHVSGAMWKDSPWIASYKNTTTAYPIKDLWCTYVPKESLTSISISPVLNAFHSSCSKVYFNLTFHDRHFLSSFHWEPRGKGPIFIPREWQKATSKCET